MLKKVHNDERRCMSVNEIVAVSQKFKDASIGLFEGMSVDRKVVLEGSSKGM